VTTPSLGTLVRSFFSDHLPVQRGLRLSSIRSYRDTIRLFLCFLASELKRKVTRLALDDLSTGRVLAFLRHLEDKRGNYPRTRNQRLAALRTFCAYIATRAPEAVQACAEISAIPTKRAAPSGTSYLERDEVISLLRTVPRHGRLAHRDRTILLFLYNTGARAQELADLRVGNLELAPPARVHINGKGGRWRTCPLWDQTVDQLRSLLPSQDTPEAPVFCGTHGQALTRFGIYKVVRRHAAFLDSPSGRGRPRRVSPHVFRHTAAVHLLEAGVEVNVIRGWLGHASLETTNRYAEITVRSKEAALRACEAELPRPSRARSEWRTDEALLSWLRSL